MASTSVAASRCAAAAVVGVARRAGRGHALSGSDRTGAAAAFQRRGRALLVSASAFENGSAADAACNCGGGKKAGPGGISSAAPPPRGPAAASAGRRGALGALGVTVAAAALPPGAFAAGAGPAAALGGDAPIVPEGLPLGGGCGFVPSAVIKGNWQVRGGGRRREALRETIGA